MRDEDAGGLQFVVEALDLDPHLAAELGVQVGQGLVEQEDVGLADNGAAHGNSLALAAAQLAGFARQEFLDAQNARDTLHALANLRLRPPRDTERIADVLEGRHVRIEPVVLKHHGDIALLGFQVVHHPVPDGNLARGHGFETGDHPEQGGLAATAGPDDDGELAIADLDVDAVDDLR